MKPAAFKYVAPRSAEEAIEHLAAYGGEARLLAGGQSLVPLINLRIARPVALIDLGRCGELDYVRREGDWLALGPMTRQITAELSPLVQECCPLVAKTMHYLGSPTIRNRGTIGGTLAHADRVAELPGVAVASGAELVAQGPKGKRTIPAEEFFVGDLSTALQPDEMLREIRFPISVATRRSTFAEATNRHHDLALIGIAAEIDLDRDRRCTRARLVAVGVDDRPVRLHRAEERLTGQRPDDAAVREAGALSLQGLEFMDDPYASAAYRRQVMGGLVTRALRDAMGEPL